MKSKNHFKLIFFAILTVFYAGCTSQNITQKSSQRDDFQKFIENKYDSLWKVPPEIAKSIAEESYVSGLSYASDSNYAFAALEFEYALKYDKSATIYLSLSDALMKLGFLDKALEAALEAYKLDPTKTDALNIIFSIYVFRRDIPSAEKVALEIYEKDPSANNLLMLGDFYSFFDPKRALEYYQKFDEINSIPEIKAIITRLQLATGDTLSAINGLIEIALTNSNPDYAWDYFDLSLQAKSYQNLYYCIDSLIGKYSLKDQTDFLSSVIYRFYFTQELINDQTKPFIKFTLNKTIDDNYNIGGNFIPSFYLAYNLNDTNLLESLLNKSIVLSDTISDVPVYAAQFFEAIGKRDSSISILERYITKFPMNPRYSIQLGYSYFLENKWEKAKNHLLNGYYLDTTNNNLLVSIGDIYDKLNKLDSAEYYYSLAILKDSENALANNNYAYFLSRDTSRLQFALELSMKSITAEPENAAYLDTYGWILFRMNKIDTALTYVKKAFELDSTNFDVAEHLGDIYESQGDIEQAIRYWEKSLELNPESRELIKKINKYRN